MKRHYPPRPRHGPSLPSPPLSCPATMTSPLLFTPHVTTATTTLRPLLSHHHPSVLPFPSPLVRRPLSLFPFPLFPLLINGNIFFTFSLSPPLSTFLSTFSLCPYYQNTYFPLFPHFYPIFHLILSLSISHSFIFIPF